MYQANVVIVVDGGVAVNTAADGAADTGINAVVSAGSAGAAPASVTLLLAVSVSAATTARVAPITAAVAMLLAVTMPLL